MPRFNFLPSSKTSPLSAAQRFKVVSKSLSTESKLKTVLLVFRGAAKKKTFFFWEISPKCVYPPTHPRVFVRFGNTKGEFSFVQNLWFLFGKLCPHPPMFGRNLPTTKKHEKCNNQPVIKTIFFGMLLREAPQKNSGFIWELLNAFNKVHPKFGFGFGFWLPHPPTFGNFYAEK